jgi:hypothetical protein
MNIVENFLLASLKPDKPGFLIAPEAVNAGLIGAIFLELSFNRTIEIKNSLVTVKRVPNSIANPVDGMIHRINKSGKSKKAKFWISKFANSASKIKQYYLSDLEKKRKIRIEKRRFLFIPYKKISLINKREREQLISILRDSLFQNKEMTAESASILGLIQACKIQKALSADKSELKEIKLKLKKLLESDQISQDVDQVIKEMHGAVIAAVTASTTAGATAAVTAAT